MELVGRHPLAQAVGSAVSAVRAHPRHVVLFALVAGLLAGTHAPELTLAVAACVAALVGRLPLALGAMVAVLAGALLGEARMEALGPGPLAASVGQELSADVVLLEPLRTRANGSVAVRARILGAAPAPGDPAARELADRGRGEVVVVRSL